MPTKKKRVGFIPREDVMKIIDKLSIENNLSNSKIISILVEEALYKRGIFNTKTGKRTQSYKDISPYSQYLSGNSDDSKDEDQGIINNKSGNCNVPDKTNLFKQANHEAFDLQTYIKFLSFLKFQEMIDEYESN